MAKEAKLARILVDISIEGIQYKSGQVVEFDTATATALEKANQADTNDAAVAYARSEGAAPVSHAKKLEVAKASE
jgi:hypothetical protein